MARKTKMWSTVDQRTTSAFMVVPIPLTTKNLCFTCAKPGRALLRSREEWVCTVPWIGMKLERWPGTKISSFGLSSEAAIVKMMIPSYSGSAPLKDSLTGTAATTGCAEQETLSCAWLSRHRNSAEVQTTTCFSKSSCLRNLKNLAIISYRLF